MASFVSFSDVADFVQSVNAQIELLTDMFDNSSMDIDGLSDFYSSHVDPWVAIKQVVAHTDMLGYNKAIDVFLQGWHCENPEAFKALGRLQELAEKHGAA